MKVKLDFTNNDSPKGARALLNLQSDFSDEDKETVKKAIQAPSPAIPTATAASNRSAPFAF